MQGVILAAGKGTRLHPITAKRSKAVAPVAGKPIVRRVMETLWENEVRSFILVISPDDEEIQEHFAAQPFQESKIQFVHQSERLGMAHALLQVADLIEGPFLLSACDNLVPSAFIGQLMERFHSARCAAVLSLKTVAPERISSVGIVDLDGEARVRGIVEKPDPAEAPSTIGSLPLYLFSEALLTYLPRVQPSTRGEYELQDAIQMLIEDDEEVLGLFTEARRQLTNAADLLKLNQHYLSSEPESRVLHPAAVGQGTRLYPPLRIEDDVTIGKACSIGPNVVLETGCTVGNGVCLRDALVLRNARVPDGAKIEGEIVADRDAT